MINPMKLAAIAELGRVQMVTGVVTEFYDTLGSALPTIVAESVKAQALLPEEVEEVALTIFIKLHHLTAMTLIKSTGKQPSLPVPANIKSLAEKFKLDLNRL